MPNPLNSQKKKPLQHRSKQTVETIIEASTRIIKKFGTEKFNTNKIAEIAGVSVGSIYQFFGSKDAILDEILNRYLEANRKIVEDALSKNNGPIDLYALIERTLTALFDHIEQSNLLTSYLIENAIRFAGISRFQKEEDKIVPIILGILEKNKIEIHSTNKELSVRICVHSIRVLIALHFLNPERQSKEDVIREGTRLIYSYLKS